MLVTLLDANNCLGAVMLVSSSTFINQLYLLSSRFLIEGSKGAILHTDFSAEPWFLLVTHSSNDTCHLRSRNMYLKCEATIALHR
jgi:hypothetical protein